MKKKILSKNLEKKTETIGQAISKIFRINVNFEDRVYEKLIELTAQEMHGSKKSLSINNIIYRAIDRWLVEHEEKMNFERVERIVSSSRNSITLNLKPFIRNKLSRIKKKTGISYSEAIRQAVDWHIRESIPLWDAIKDNYLRAIRQYIEEGRQVDARDKENQTPLMWAAFYGREEIVKLLLESGTDVNAKDKDGDTPLKIAVRYGHNEIVKILKEAGAKDEELKAEENTNNMEVKVNSLWAWIKKKLMGV